MSQTSPTWPWQKMNEGNASAHDVLAALLDARPGERWLDIGTGGGGLALRLARNGAAVVGVDVAEDGLEHARDASAEAGVDTTFRYGDAQDLPFADGEFDGVASAFGVIFAPDRERAASELARVCRPGGKLGLTLMPLDSRTGATFTVLVRHGAPHHPASWETDLEQLLGAAFEIEVDRRESPGPVQSAPPWDDFVRAFAPLRKLVSELDEDGVASLRREFETIAERYEGRPSSYVVVLGRRG